MPLGYRFPEPGLFVGVQTDEKRAHYLRNWLSSRSAWLARVLAHYSDPSGASGQEWREFLMANKVMHGRPAMFIEKKPTHLHDNSKESGRPSVIPAGEVQQPAVKKGGRSAATIAARREKVAQMLGPEREEALPPTLFFHGTAISSDNLQAVVPQLIPKVLWELVEHNFRYDLLALDRSQVPQLWDGGIEILRETQLLGLFPDASFCMVEGSFPTRDVGLAAADIAERLVFVGRLRAIMKSWAEPPLELFSLCGGDESTTDLDRNIANMKGPLRQEAEKLEVVVAQFYCQSFYDFFRRAPVVPHRLPV